MKIVKPTQEQIKQIIEAFQESQTFIEMCETPQHHWPFDFEEDDPFGVKHYYYETCDAEPVLFDRRTEMALKIAKRFLALNWEQAILSLSTLIDNCTDPNATTLEWRPDIAEFLNSKEPASENKTPEEIKIHFDSLDERAQWLWAWHHRGDLTICLDYETTTACITEDLDSDEPAFLRFKSDIGNRSGLHCLLEIIGFTSEEA